MWIIFSMFVSVGETEKTIAYMCNNDASHVIVQWAIWMTGNIGTCLSKLYIIRPSNLIIFM